MKTKILFIAACLCFLFASCEYDNYDAPSAKLSGRVVYEGNPVGVRTNGTQLELWQDGYALYTKIPVYIAQDGTFSASLFNGSYKLVRLAGAPWENQTGDTLRIEVKGNTVVDVPVKPYFIIKNESYQKGAGNAISVKFTIEKVVESAEVVSVNFYLGKGILTDHNKNENGAKDEDGKSIYKRELDLSTLVLGQEVTMDCLIPEELLKIGSAFARIGVQSNKSNEYYYTQVQKISF